MTQKFSMYVVTSGSSQHTVDVVTQCATAGANVIQIREKTLSTREMIDFATACSRAIYQANPSTRVVIDDRIDVVWYLRNIGEHINGVHLGMQDFPVKAARKLLGNKALIGLTTGTLDLVLQAQQYADVIDYLGAGPFRPTPTKQSNRPPIGVEGYYPLVQASSIPIVAIGDVKVGDVKALMSTGIAGVAMVREVMNAKNPASIVKAVLAQC